MNILRRALFFNLLYLLRRQWCYSHFHSSSSWQSQCLRIVFIVLIWSCLIGGHSLFVFMCSLVIRVLSSRLMFFLIRARANCDDFKFVLISQTVSGITTFAIGDQLAVEIPRFSLQASVRFAKRLKHCIFHEDQSTIM